MSWAALHDATMARLPAEARDGLLAVAWLREAADTLDDHAVPPPPAVPLTPGPAVLAAVLWHWAESPVLPCNRPEAVDAEGAPRAAAEVHRSPCWAIVQTLKAVPELRRLTGRAAFLRFAEACAQTSRLTPEAAVWRLLLMGYDDAEADFLRGWKRGKLARGESILAWAHAEAGRAPVTITPPADLPDRPAFRRFLAFCFHLQALKPAGHAFPLVQSGAAEVFGVRRQTIGVWLETLADAGVLTVAREAVRKPSGGRAAEYRLDLSRVKLATAPAPGGDDAA